MIFSSYAQKISRRAKIFRIATLACYKGFGASAAVVSSHPIQSIDPSTFVDILLFTFLPPKGESPSVWPDILNADITPSDRLCQTGSLAQRSDQTKTNIVNQSLRVLLWQGFLALLDEKTAVLGAHTLVIR